MPLLNIAGLYSTMNLKTVLDLCQSGGSNKNGIYSGRITGGKN
jgi:hypothetical protein